MKEGEIEDKDGNKLPVYWHNEPLPHEAKPEDTGITEKGVGGCCPIGPAGQQGEVGVPSKHPKMGFPKAMSDAIQGDKTAPTLKEMLNKYLYGSAPASILIDDSLEKDIVETPIKGRIYKIRQINVVARFRGTHLISPDEGRGEWVVYEMRLRDMTLFINKEDLLLASEAEVETFIDK